MTDVVACRRCYETDGLIVQAELREYPGGVSAWKCPRCLALVALVAVEDDDDGRAPLAKPGGSVSAAEQAFLEHCLKAHSGASDSKCDECDLLWQRIDFGWPIQPPRGDGGPVSQRADVLLALDEIGGEWEAARAQARRLAAERERLLLHGKMLGATVTDLARAGRMSRDTAHRLLRRKGYAAL